MAIDLPEGLSPPARRLAWFDAAFFKVEGFFNLIAGLGIFFVMLLGVAQVVGRSVFNVPVRGYVDIIELSISVFAFLGIAYCQRLNGHIRMEIVIGRFKGRVRWVTEIIGTLIAMFVIAVLMVYGWDHFLRAWTIGDSTMDINVPLWPSKLLVPAAFAMLLVRLAVQLIGFIRLALYPDDPHEIAIPRIETVDEVAQHEIETGLAGEHER